MKNFLYCFVFITAILMSAGCSTTQISDCLAGSDICDNTCVNLQEDQLNCGSCGNACAAGNVCSGGTCVLSCQMGLDDCSGSCRDLQTDQDNCGACGNNCVAGQSCVAGSCETWMALTGIDEYGLVDFVPAGQDPLLSTGSDLYRYSVVDDMWSNPFTGLMVPGTYAYPAWDGDRLYWLDGGDVYSLLISDGSTTQDTVPMMPTSSCAQNTADEAHNIYAVAENGDILQYNNVTGNLMTFTGAPDVPGSGDEPRMAWDSLSQKLYFGDYNDVPFYSLDPADGTLTPLPSFPDLDGLNDAFCSDRHGFIYSTDASGANHLLWIFDTLAGVWNSSNLPFEVGSSGSCTVSGDGILYLLGDGVMYGLKVF